MTTQQPEDEHDAQDQQAREGSDESNMCALIPRHFDFYGDDLLAVQGPLPDKQVWVHLARLVECLGLTLSDQIEHIRRNEVMREGLRSLPIVTKQGVRDALFLRLGLTPFYLATIQINRVKPALREKLLRYQREAADVLYTYFLGDLGIIEPGREQHPGQGLTSTEQAYEQAQLLANLARQQLLMEREVGNTLEQMTSVQEVMALQDERIGQLELTLGIQDKITEVQATEIKEAVTAIGVIKGEKQHNTRMVGPTIQAVWKMFYREFGVRVYHNLPRSRFDEAMAFLRGVAKQFGVELDKGGQ
ncbi:MAG: ORF6C domain-containing protein [Ktedonobacteraceae bacterium]|nr:ORF6C domain-containing protein [Ktedonobacteraceae bacterium]